MALPENIMNPIPGDNPCGQSLRYSPIYDKIKEARREEQELPQGEWSRDVKQADPAAVIKLATEALSTKTKDLQLAAWLTEALLRQRGIGGLKEGFGLLQGLVANFWDTLYPEAEDGDVELRVAPLNWVGSYLGEQIKKTPITKGGFSLLKYAESRAVGTEEACAGNDAKMEARSTAIAEGKLAPEEFDKDVESTPRNFYVALLQDLDGAVESLQSLDEVCAEKAGRDSPGFGTLRDTLEEIQSLVRSYLKSKPDPNAVAEPEPEAGEEVSEAAEEAVQDNAVHAPARRRAPKGELAEPADEEDAIRRITGASRFLRGAQPYSPVPYLVLRAVRWGELRAGGSPVQAELLGAPPTESRQQLKRLAVEGNWAELLDAAENTMACSNSRAWLDLQRYAVRACQELGSDYDAVGKAIRSGVGALITDFPELPECTFLDDTPVANPETLAWLREIVASAQPSNDPVPEPLPIERNALVGGEAQGPDAEELAIEAARAGRTGEAVEILTREIAQVRSGRARFERKTQLASLCLTTRHELIAYPILRELADEIEKRQLEEWESPAVLAKPLVLLFRCLDKVGGDSDEKQRVYDRICRLDPVQALACLK